MNTLKSLLLLLLSSGACLQGYAEASAETGLSGESNPGTSWAIGSYGHAAGSPAAEILRVSSAFSEKERIVLILHDGRKVKGTFRCAGPLGVELFLTPKRIEAIRLEDIESMALRPDRARKVLAKTGEVLGKTVLVTGVAYGTVFAVYCSQDLGCVVGGGKMAWEVVTY